MVKMFQNKKYLEIIGIFFTFLGLAFFFNMISSVIEFNSDDAVMVIMAKDFLDGNWFFHGWTFTQDSFTTTSIPYYVAGILIGGFSPDLMHDIPAVIYALLVIVSSYLASQGFDSQRKWLVRIIVAIGLTTIIGPWNMYDFFPHMHIGTILMVVSSLFLLQSKNKLREIAAYATMTLAIVSDPVALFIGPVPILLLLGYEKIRKNKINNNTNGRLALKTITTIATGEIIYYIIPVIGGYNNDRWYYNLGFSEIIRNIVSLGKGLPTVYGSYFIGHQIDVTGIGYFARLILLVCLGYVIWKWLSNRDSFSFLDSILVIGMFLVVVGFIINPITMPSNNYLFPVVIYGIILMGRYAMKVNWSRRYVFVGVGVGTLIIITWASSITLSPPVVNDSLMLTNWLLNHNLHSGYGSYFNSHIVTVYSKGEISVAPVVAWGYNLTLSQYPVESYVKWYKNPQQPPRTFLVYDDSNWGVVNDTTAIKTWGNPISHERVKNFTILIWDHPILTNPLIPSRIVR